MALPSSDSNGITAGQAKPTDQQGLFNNVAFAIQQGLSRMQTATLVRVDACTNEGGVSPVGFVDVTPLVNQIDAQGNPTPHTTIFNLPYLRVQGGGNAIIIDPVPGDVGICVFASRDISKVKSTKTQANPGSFRKYDFSDGMYLGGMLNGTPSQYVRFTDTGIEILSPTAITLTAPDVTIVGTTSLTLTAPTIEITGDTTITGTLDQAGGASNMTGPVTVDNDLTAAGISVSTHVHSGVDAGADNSGPPV